MLHRYQCCFCDQPPFCLRRETLEHLKAVHHIVIDDCDNIVGLAAYLNLLRAEVEAGRKSFPPLGSDEEIHIAEKDNPSEVTLRTAAHQAALADMLQRMEEERATARSMTVACVFCPTICTSRSGIFRHMRATHGFSVGHPDNVVYLDELMATLRDALSRCVCLYCRHTFKSAPVLRLHMRKKKHFKIHPSDHTYDPFFAINYLERERTWQQLRAEPDDEDVGEDSGEGSNNGDAGAGGAESQGYEDVEELDSGCEERAEVQPERLHEGDDGWHEVELPGNGLLRREGGVQEEETQCLFCEAVFATPDEATRHHVTVHGFDLDRCYRSSWGLDFYDCVKIINFIRAKVRDCRCPYCGGSFASPVALREHFAAMRAASIAAVTSAPPPPRCPRGTDTCDAALEGPTEASAGEAGSTTGGGSDEADGPVTHCGVMRCDPAWRDECYLFPTLPGDPLLLHVDDFDPADAEANPLPGASSMLTTDSTEAAPLLTGNAWRVPLFEGDAIGVPLGGGDVCGGGDGGEIANSGGERKPMKTLTAASTSTPESSYRTIDFDGGISITKQPAEPPQPVPFQQQALPPQESEQQRKEGGEHRKAD